MVAVCFYSRFARWLAKYDANGVTKIDSIIQSSISDIFETVHVAVTIGRGLACLTYQTYSQQRRHLNSICMLPNLVFGLVLYARCYFTLSGWDGAVNPQCLNCDTVVVDISSAYLIPDGSTTISSFSKLVFETLHLFMLLLRDLGTFPKRIFGLII